MSAYTVQAAVAVYCYATVTVEADSIEDACRGAIDEANAGQRWKASDRFGNAFTAAIGEVRADPGGTHETRGRIPEAIPAMSPVGDQR